MKLHLENFTRKNTLNHVGSVEAIHAIGAHDSRLPLFDLTRICRYLASFVKAYLEFTNEISVVLKLLLNNCDELADILDFLDFCVVVKPVVFNVGVVELLDDLCKLAAEPALASFFVNQIDQVLAAIHSIRLLDVRLGGGETLIEIFVHDYWWVPLHVGLVAPGERDRATDLQEGCNGVSSAHALPHSDNLLVFAEVGRTAVLVQAASDKATPRSPDVAPGYKSHFDFVTNG